MFQPGAASVRALAVKFLEVYVLLFTSNASGHEGALTEGIELCPPLGNINQLTCFLKSFPIFIFEIVAELEA